MKKRTILIIFLVFHSLLLFSQERDRNYILVLSVELNMNTSFSIDCDNFETALRSMLTINGTWQSDSIALFNSFVQKAKYAKHNREIDVRCKFVYEPDDNHNTTVFTDGFDILINGRLIKRNKKFISFLKSIAYGHP
jgi:hypothetical protein